MDEQLSIELKRTMANIATFMDRETKHREELERKVNLLRIGGGGTQPERRTGPDELKHAIRSWYGTGRDGALADFGEKEFGHYKSGIATYLRHGLDALRDEERKAMSVAVDPQGGYLVVPDNAGRIVERVRELSPIRRFASVQPTASDRLEGIADVNDLDSGWVGETQSRPETGTPDVGKYEIPVHEIYAMPKASQKVLDDSALNVEDWLAGKVSSRFARQEAAAFISGNGVLKPRGILTYPTATTADATRAWGTLQYVATGHASAFIAPTSSASPADCLIDLVYALKATHRMGARWLMNSLTAGVVRKFKDADGKFVWTDRISEGQPPLLLGYPVEFAEDMPDVGAGNFPILFGDLMDAYQIVDRLGIRVLRDPYTQKGWVLFYSTMRVGGAVVNFEAIKLLKVATS